MSEVPEVPEVPEFELHIKKLVELIYKEPPQEKYTFQIVLPDGVEIQEFLGYFLYKGASILFDTQIGFLTAEQIGILQKYLRSIGWDAEWKVETRVQEFEVENIKETRNVNYYMIDFFPAAHSKN